MMYTATMTTKGQVTVPVEIRRWLGLKPYEKVAFVKQDDQVVVKKPADILDLMGVLKSDIKASDADWDKAVEKYVGEEYAKKEQFS